ncbi:MAG: RNA polymerase factor sigma-54, partial [Halofilum sp. (in: g-proteobacteria)]
MKQSLQIRLGQQLTMTPQLQQAIRLLQLSSLELQATVQETLEANPMLDLDEEAEDEAADDATEHVTAHSEHGEGVVAVNGHDADGFADEYSGAWGAAGFGVAEDDDRDFFETRSSGGDSLRDHLLEQLHLSAIGAQDRQIGAALVEAVRDDGYLSES